MLYIDVDATCKLAHWNLLQVLPELTGFKWNEIATVSSLKYRAQDAIAKLDKHLFHTTDAAILAFNCMDKMANLPAPNANSLTMFENDQQINTGEAVLMALTINDSNGYFLTGDKRALHAVSRHEECVSLIAGRVIMIEQILLWCLEMKGCSWLRINVCPNKHIDKAVSAIIGSHCDASEESIKTGIISYISEIENLHNPSLLVAN